MKRLIYAFAMLLCAVQTMAQTMPRLTEKERTYYRSIDTDSFINSVTRYVQEPDFMAHTDTIKRMAAAKDSTTIMAGCHALTLLHYRLTDNGPAMRQAVDSIMMYPFAPEWDEYIFSCWKSYPCYLSDKQHYVDALKALEDLQEFANNRHSNLGSFFFHYCSGYLFLSMFQTEQAEEHIAQAKTLLDMMPRNDFHQIQTEHLYSLLLRCYDASDNRHAEHQLAMKIVNNKAQFSNYARMCAYVALFCSENGDDAQALRKQYADSINALVSRMAWTASVKRPYNKFRSVNAMYNGKLDSAIYYANHAIDTLNCLVRSGMIYAHFGRYKDAYESACAAYKELNQRSRADLTASLTLQVDRMERVRLQHVLEMQNAASQKRVLLYVLAFALVLLAFVGYEIYRAIRHSKELEQEKNATQEALQVAENASRMKTVFLQNVSHELRTPLNAISGFSDLLTAGIELSPEQQAECGDLVKHNVGLLTKLIGDTIMLSNLDSEAVVPQPTDVDVRSLCATICDETPVMKYAHKGVTMHYDLPDEPVKLYTDPHLLTSILQQLLSNAFKYTQEGHVTLSLKHCEGDVVEIAVTDTGCGIAPGDAEAVFERFEKLGSFVQGNGLGLSIARETAKLLHATVTLDTTHQGTGARFVVRINENKTTTI